MASTTRQIIADLRDVGQGIGRWRSWFELCRLPMALVAAADPLAGALIVGAGWRHIPVVGLLMCAAVCIYAGAAALNDWHDLRTDRIIHPQRPIPSGRVRRWVALPLALMLIAAGWVLAASSSKEFMQVACLLVAGLAAYEFLLKYAPIAELVPGLCRGLSLLLGMTLILPAESSVSMGMRVYLAGMIAVYVSGVRVFGHRSEERQGRQYVLAGGITMAMAILGVAMTRIFYPVPTPYASGAVWLGLLLVLVASKLVPAFLCPSPAAAHSAATMAMLGTVLLVATPTGYVRGLTLSLLPALCVVPAWFVDRWLTSLPGPPALETIHPPDVAESTPHRGEARDDPTS